MMVNLQVVRAPLLQGGEAIVPVVRIHCGHLRLEPPEEHLLVHVEDQKLTLETRRRAVNKCTI